jgi:hypothetical protein
MVNNFDVAKALKDQANIIATANDYILISTDESNPSDVNGSYIEEFTLFGDDNSIGISDASSDIQIGIYQLSVYVPKTSSKWAALAIIGVLQFGFPKGLEMIYNAQTVRAKNSSISPLMQNDTHLIYHLSIAYSVIN